MDVALILAVLVLSTGAGAEKPAGELATNRRADPEPQLPAELRGAQLIDSMVARVNRHPITASQLEYEARLAMVQHGDLSEAGAPLSAGELRSALDYLVDQILLDDEAENLKVFEVTEDEGRAGVQRLIQCFPTAGAYRGFLERFGVPDDAVEGAVRRALRADRYLADKIRVQVSRGAAPGEAQAAAKEVVRQLRSRADIRFLSHFGADRSETSAQPRPPGTEAVLR